MTKSERFGYTITLTGEEVTFLENLISDMKSQEGFPEEGPRHRAVVSIESSLFAIRGGGDLFLNILEDSVIKESLRWMLKIPMAKDLRDRMFVARTDAMAAQKYAKTA